MSLRPRQTPKHGSQFSIPMRGNELEQLLNRTGSDTVFDPHEG